MMEDFTNNYNYFNFYLLSNNQLRCAIMMLASIEITSQNSRWVFEQQNKGAQKRYLAKVELLLL